MARKKRQPTIWQVPDDLWQRIEPLIREIDPPKATGRPRQDARRILDAVIFRFRTGCQWNQIPSVYGDDATLHRTFQHWRQLGLFSRIWAVLIEECDELGAVNWEWQAADTAMGKARMGGDQIGPNPTDRGKKGTKRSIVTDSGGGPLGVVVAPANVHDTKLLDQTLEAIVVERPQPTPEAPQHLCLDKGYDNPTGDDAVSKHGYVGHVRRIGEEKLDNQGQKNIQHAVGW
jgi:putative transposase